MKSIAVILMAGGLGASASLFAMSTPPTEEKISAIPPSVQMTLSQPQESWFLGFVPLYQQVNNGYDHNVAATVTTVNGAISTTDRSVSSMKDANHWGAHLYAGYNFADSARYIALGYTFLTTNDSVHVPREAGELLNGIGFGIGSTVLTALNPFSPIFASTGWDEAKSKSESQYNAVDVVVGQRFNVGPRVTFDTFGGLRYAGIRQENTMEYSAAAQILGIGLTEIATERLASDFDGLGPRAGVNVRVGMSRGFAVTGSVAGSLLVGKGSENINRQQEILSIPGGIQLRSEKTHQSSGDNVEVVPELDARLGISYSADFTADTAVGIELGYEVTHYFNINHHSQLVGGDTADHTNGFAMQGPYAQLHVDLK